MKREKFLPIFLVSVILFFISFIMGYQLMQQNINMADRNTKEGEYSQEDSPDIKIITEEKVISPNTFIEERIYYTSCGHIETKIKKANEEYVNMSRSQFEYYLEENYPNQKLISFSSSRITVGINKNQLCKDHYIVGEYEGKIAIFKIDDDGERVLDKIFSDYPISLLMKVDQDRLKEGIVVDSEEELSNVLENFIS